MQERADLQEKMKQIYSNLTERINEYGTENYDGALVVDLLNQYSEAVPNASKRPEEIEWNMLSAQAFITSVQTTTGEENDFKHSQILILIPFSGYGDIIPVTFWGRFFTLCYALVGIPVFMWYIFKLGVFFRLVVMKIIFWFLLIFWYSNYVIMQWHNYVS